ncbi:DUF4260 family protein [Acinetobacter qingfengensis]|uniref:Uncharacterized protein n=1 Tax=Acinetobacter qingfengensis TaxID=1262585 RepID=A0A1E7RDD4_9GAMM|nr:DUF4260 domain-containing protein [Acinetobacter qingfengensis]KAA8734446.1 DUF4260 family protein [Acinetobacter qingfengensis]OEY97358.1 hypothetical protein BJI46_10250 [Acinetobacter qingfengensis]
MNDTKNTLTSTQSNVRKILQIEGLCVLVLSLIVYEKFGIGWGTFAIFFLTPDISLLGYLLNSKIGSVFYNAAHSYLLPFVILGLGIYFNVSIMWATAIIWTAHIGFDRMLGYGLKYSNGFHFTHLGVIGSKK